MAGGRFKKSSNHLPFSISLLPRGERRLLGAIRLSDRTVPDSEPDPGIRAPSLHWTRAEMHAGKDLVLSVRCSAQLIRKTLGWIHVDLKCSTLFLP